MTVRLELNREVEAGLLAQAEAEEELLRCCGSRAWASAFWAPSRSPNTAEPSFSAALRDGVYGRGLAQDLTQ
jgi:hypothetical protein